MTWDFQLKERMWLQVSLACEGGNERNLEAYGAMWRSLKGAHCLQNLHVVLRSIHIAEVDKQVMLAM